MSEVDVMLKAGLSFHERGDWAQANSCYQRVLALAPNSSMAWHLSGRLAMDVGLFSEADDFIARACELDPGVADYVLTKGTLLAMTGQYESARECYENALRLDQSLREAYLGIAETFVCEARFQEARALAEPLIGLSERLNVKALSIVGECRFQDESLKDFLLWWSGVRGTGFQDGNVLHVGCGRLTLTSYPDLFQAGRWSEIRLDIDPSVLPDVVGSTTKMDGIEKEWVKVVYSSHNLEHLQDHEVPLALREFHRVLLPGGVAIIHVPDLQAVCEMVAQDRLYDTAYVSPAGPIAPIDMIFGLRKAIEDGNFYMRHTTGFTASSLGMRIKEAGFDFAFVKRLPGFGLAAIGLK